MKSTPFIAAAVAGSLATIASAQIVINEVFENPPNGGDDTWEFIELYGPAGYDLTGYSVVLLKGGVDEDGDDIPDGSNMQKHSEIDEAFSLDGWKIGPNGYFVLYHTAQFGATGMDAHLTPNPDYKFFLPESLDNPRFLDGASFLTLHIPSVDVVGKLGNEDSSTYMLVRKRPGHSLDENGNSVYASDFGWKKDAAPDADYNSRIDFGDEHTLGVPIYVNDGLEGTQAGALMMQPVQIVDELAWSNSGGKEYNTPGRGDNSNKISETPGFNPDAVSRVRYLPVNPLIGWTIDNDGDLKRNTSADESWIYGETRDYSIGSPSDADDIQPGEEGFLQYRPDQVDLGDDAVPSEDDELNWYAPIDPNGPTYSYTGPGDFNPLAAPFFDDSGAIDPMGDLLFNAYNIVGFELTPGQPNDTPDKTSLVGTALETQFRWVEGDFDFDADVDCDDAAMIESMLGASLDDTAMFVRDFNTDETEDDVMYEGWARQLDGFNSLLAMIRMDLEDGTTGEWDSGVTVTQADIDAHAALLGATCAGNPADLDASGTVGSGDLAILLAAWGAPGETDLDGNGVTGSGDLAILLAAWGSTGGR